MLRCGTETPPLLLILATKDTPIRREIGWSPTLEEILSKELEEEDKKKKRVGPRRSPPSL